MPAFDRAWIDAVCAACDPVFEAADVGFVRHFSRSGPDTMTAILWEAEPLRFAARYPDSRVEASYGDQWPAPCIDDWIYFADSHVELSFEGPPPPVARIPVTGDGELDACPLIRPGRVPQRALERTLRHTTRPRAPMPGMSARDGAMSCRAAPALETRDMSSRPRRVVTGHTLDGVSVVVSDGPVP